MPAKKKLAKSPQKRSSKKPSPKGESATLSESQWWYLAIACACCSLLLYCNTLWNDFTFDDYTAVVNNPDVRGESSLSALLRNDFWATPLVDTLSNKSYRPLTTLSFRISAALHGIQPTPFHLYNIVLNAIACYMSVYCIQSMTTSTSCLWIFPLTTALLYTFHPIHTEVVATVVGRADLLSAIFVFASFLLSNKCIQDNQSITSRHFVLSLACAWLSALSKETGLMVLAINGVAEITQVWLSRHDNCKKAISASVVRFGVFALTGVTYLLFRKFINGPSTGILPSASDNPLIQAESSTQYALTAMYCMVVYIWRLVNPFVLLCDYGYNVIPLIEGWSDVRNLATLIVLMSVAGLVYLGFKECHSQKNDARILMALAWIFIPLLPASHVLILGTVVAERLLYLPSLGYCMLIGVLAEKVSSKKQKTNILSATLVVVLALYSQRILSRNKEWSTDETLWKATYASHPQNTKVAISYAADLGFQGDNDSAYHIVSNLNALGDVQQFELCKVQAKMTALSDAGGRNFTRAYQILDKCIDRINARATPSQKDHVVYGTYGYLKSQQADFEQAAEWFRKASDSAERTGVNPLGPICNQGEILARLGKWSDSVPVLRKCVDLSIASRERTKDTKLMNLAKALYMTREYDEAEELLVHDLPQTRETLDFLETVRKTKRHQRERQQEREAEASSSITADD